MENHRSKLDALLFAEEIEMEEEMREFDMEMVNRRIFCVYYLLTRRIFDLQNCCTAVASFSIQACNYGGGPFPQKDISAPILLVRSTYNGHYT